MVFIRPKILRDGVATAIETNSKYNYIRGEQARQMTPEVLPLLPRSNGATLPPLSPEQKARETAPPPAEPVKGTEAPADAKAPADAPPNAPPAAPPPAAPPPAPAASPAKPGSGGQP
jgi:hypothetical protein